MHNLLSYDLHDVSSESDFSGRAELFEMANSSQKERCLPEYEHFSFFQSIFMGRSDAVEHADPAACVLSEIVSQLGQPEVTQPLERPSHTCEILFSPEKHAQWIPSLKKPLRVGLIFA